MKSYIIGLLTNYLGLVLTMSIQVFLMPFLLSTIGPRQTGVYYLFMTVSNFVAIGITWLTGAGVYLLASSDQKAARADFQEIHWAVFLGYGTYATLILGMVCLWAFAAGHWWLCDSDAALIGEARNACFFLGLYIWVRYVHQSDLALYMARLEQGWANLYRVISQSIFIFLVALIVMHRPRLDLLMLANFISGAIAAAGARLHLRCSGRLGPWRWHLPDRILAKQMFMTRGLSYFIFGLAQYGLIYGDVLLIGAVLGPAKVSAWLIIWRIPDVMGILLWRVSEILSPYLTRLGSASGHQAVARLFLCTSRLQHVLGILAGIGYAFFGPSVVALWVGEAHRPETPWFYWLAGAVLAIQSVNRHDIVLHYALAKLGHLIKIQFAELLLKLGITMLLFTRFDVVAPLITTLMIQLCGLTWFYRASALRQLGIGWQEWLARVGIWSGAALVLAGISAFFIHRWIPRASLTGFLVCVFCYAGIAVLILLKIEKYQQQNGLFHICHMLTQSG
ncbi:hypothetical protein DENIS_1635 [Desulfonema ishimotonii]|uniref:Polysaccharide biosynthesis protein n=1 Tax=Desulfonema ishimotonii TaxID=45657 RepID=A0A401FUQ2_9BACT|nr:hypothetical protein [Desulfonema ishimotonii]GBC60678.1 hypothetical protein DENIS_1635 [Desulfonema ishimotonii]